MATNRLAELIYEVIDDTFCKAQYGDFFVLMMSQNGFMNATKLAASGGKSFFKWTENAGFKQLLKHYESKLVDENTPSLIIKVMDGPNELRGSYVHPRIIACVAQWVSPEFSFKVGEILENYLLAETRRRLLKARLLLKKKNGKITKLELDMAEIRENHQETMKELRQTRSELVAANTKLDTANKKLVSIKHELKETKVELERVSSRVTLVAKHIVPPEKHTILHEQFGVFRLNDAKGKRQYKVYCSQTRNVATAKAAICSMYPKAEALLEIKPHANAKNFLHHLKEMYGEKCLEVKYNYIKLRDGVTEDDLVKYVNKVVLSNEEYSG